MIIVSTSTHFGFDDRTTVLPKKVFNFPCGETHVKLDFTNCDSANVDVEFVFENVNEIVELLLVCDAIKRSWRIVNTLNIPYVPFARQDRINVSGEAFSLAVFADLINGIGANEVVVTDPHSDVVPALIKNCKVIHQHEVFAPLLKDKKDFWIISPDAGSLKKIYKLAAIVDCAGVIECSKNRDVKTGEITGTVVHTDDLQGKDCIILDDIIDGGKTFIEIAKVLRTKNCSKVVLAATHGFFTKGIGVFEGLVDEIYTRSGRVK